METPGHEGYMIKHCKIIFINRVIASNPAGIYLFKVNAGNTKPICENQQWKYQSNIWNLFKVNNKGTKNDAINIVLVSLFLPLNRFYTLF